MKNEIVLGETFDSSTNRKHGEIYLNLKDSKNIFVKNEKIEHLATDSSWIQINPDEVIYDVIKSNSYKPNTIAIEVEPRRDGAWFKVRNWYHIGTETASTVEETVTYEPASQEAYQELELFGIF